MRSSRSSARSGDEHDVKRPRPAAEAPLIEVDGAITIRDLDTPVRLGTPRRRGL